jgi:hypothetical protein
MKTWKKSTLAAAIAAAITPWAVQGQTVELTQTGDSNRLETTQTQVSGASIVVGQTGVDALVSIQQIDGAYGASAQVEQESQGGTVRIEQAHAAHSALVSQTADGEGSLARITQRSSGDPTGAQASLIQQGTAVSTAEILQDSTAASANLEQRGTRSAGASITQRLGSGAQATVQQNFSTGAEARVDQSMSATTVRILQARSNGSFASINQSQALQGAQIEQTLNEAVHASINQLSTASEARISQMHNTATRASVMQIFSTGSGEIAQRGNLDTTAHVEQEFASGASSISVGQDGNRSTTAMAIQRRGVVGGSINVSQNSNERVAASATQEGFGTGGPAPRNTGSQIQLGQLGNRDSEAQVTQGAGTHQASVNQTGNAGARVVVQQFAVVGERFALVNQTGNSAGTAITALTQQGGHDTRAEVVQASNAVGTLQAGVLQTTSGDIGGLSWASGAFVADDFLPARSAGSYLGDNVGNRAEITQGGNTGTSVAAGIAMLGASNGIATVRQSDNAGATLGLIRMVGVRDGVNRITQRDNLAGTQVVALSEQGAVDGMGNAGLIELEQESNTGGEVWMKAVQSGVDAALMAGRQSGSASVHAYLRQEPGSSGSAATIEQRGVSAGQALIRQGTGDGAVDAGIPISAAALIGLMNTDPGPARGAALASTATLLQSDGAQLSAGIVQTGSALNATITQTGVWKEASIIQNGVGHQASIVQGGTAVGAQASGVEIRQYGAMPLSATITQHSAGSRIAIVQQ